MKHQKKLPTKQLEKFSAIFTKLGLVMVLFIVYITLEYKTLQKEVAIIDFRVPEKMMIDPDQAIIFVKEPKNEPVKENSKAQVFLPDEPIKKSKDEFIETIIVDEPPKDIVQIDIDKIIEIDEPSDIIEDVPYDFVQYAPVFKGCENLSKEANKVCFDKKMKQFVTRNFNIELANEIGWRSGKYKILTQFVIDDKGEVIDVKIKTTHKTLEKEANRVINKLPKFKPGIQNNNFVKVKYTLPISFRID